MQKVHFHLTLPCEWEQTALEWNPLPLLRKTLHLLTDKVFIPLLLVRGWAWGHTSQHCNGYNWLPRTNHTALNVMNDIMYCDFMSSLFSPSLVNYNLKCTYLSLFFLLVSFAYFLFWSNCFVHILNQGYFCTEIITGILQNYEKEIIQISLLQASDNINDILWIYKPESKNNLDQSLPL